MTTPSIENGTTASPRRVLRRVLRVARDVAIGVTLIAAIPVTFITVTEHQRDGKMSYAEYRLLEMDRFRIFKAPVQAEVTPEAAGAALRRLMPSATHSKGAGTVDASPLNPVLPPGLFVNDLAISVWNGPMPTRLIKEAGKGVWTYEKLGISPSSGLRFSLSDGMGLSQEEQDWLKALAQSPIWKDLDLVAGAARMDMLVPRSQLPFNDQLSWSRRLSFAGVARAAYYVSIADRASAEAALRALMTFGFALQDNGLSSTEASVGRGMIQAGLVGLRQLYELDGRSNLVSMTDPFPFYPPDGGVKFQDLTAATVRDAALRYATDSSLPRSFRFEQLSVVARSTCGDVRSLLLGPSNEVQHAFDVARQSLAETDAERQYVDLLERNGTAASLRAAPPGFVDQVRHGAAVVASAVTGNPRITGCMSVVMHDDALGS